MLDDNGVVVMLSGGCTLSYGKLEAEFGPGALLDITQRRQHLMSQTQRADEALELKRLQDHFIDMLASLILLTVDFHAMFLTQTVSRTPESAQRDMFKQRRRS